MTEQRTPGSGSAYWANLSVDPKAKAAANRAIERAKRNVAAGLPFEHGADPHRTCIELDIPIDHDGRRAFPLSTAA